MESEKEKERKWTDMILMYRKWKRRKTVGAGEVGVLVKDLATWEGIHLFLCFYVLEKAPFLYWYTAKEEVSSNRFYTLLMLFCCLFNFLCYFLLFDLPSVLFLVVSVSFLPVIGLSLLQSISQIFPPLVIITSIPLNFTPLGLFSRSVPFCLLSSYFDFHLFCLYTG